jgi:mRNA interferase RelE/StbE
VSDSKEPEWRVVYSDGFARDLGKLDRTQARRILKYLAERIDGQSDPRAHGHALAGLELGGLWRYRIGDYRVITELTDETCTVLALRVGHRSTIYR